MQKFGLRILFQMDKSKQDEIIKIINDDIAKTESAIERYKELTKPIAPENAIGRVSRMDAINNKSVMLLNNYYFCKNQ